MMWKNLFLKNNCKEKNMNDLFNPKVVAVIGASANREKIGYALAFNLLNDKKERQIAARF